MFGDFYEFIIQDGEPQLPGKMHNLLFWRKMMQNKAKKLMLPLIAVMMMLGLPAGMPIAAYAEEAGSVPTVYASDAQGNVGDIVEVNIGIRNNPGIVATRLAAHYDMSALRLDSVADKGLFGTTTHLNQLTSPYIMLWDNSDAPENYTGNGDQITLRFEVLSDSGSDITVAYNEKPGDIDIIDFDLDPVYFAVVNGKGRIFYKSTRKIVMFDTLEA